MRILILCHSFNSLTQRLFVELTECGHEVSVEFDIHDRVTAEAVTLFGPDLILAPFLKRAIPESIWRSLPCLILHPGIPGDRGPSALDWAILNSEVAWGVTVLQATAEMDAGPIWATAQFAMRKAAKSSLYRFEVTEAAVSAVLESIAYFPDYCSRHWQPTAQTDWPELHGQSRPALRGQEARIDWTLDDTATVLAKIRSADGAPGRIDTLFGEQVRVYNAKPYPALGAPGALLGMAAQGLVRATHDGAIWIGHARRGKNPIKRPLAQLFPECLSLSLLDASPVDPIHYEEHGPVGMLHFDVYNGALDTESCIRLREAWLMACQRPTRILILMGGHDFFCNGLDLNAIEAAESPADTSWANINAMDDLCETLMQTTDRLTLAALHGNAGAGGTFLALACDAIWARKGVILNPHYKNMGNLYGSEFWTYRLPRRMGNTRLLDRRLPLGSTEALRLGFIDRELSPADFDAQIIAQACHWADSPGFATQLSQKQLQRATDEADKPLASYRTEELKQMQRNFYGFDASYHVARAHFVNKTAHAWTPRHLARHREPGF